MYIVLQQLTDEGVYLPVSEDLYPSGPLTVSDTAYFL